MLRGTHTAPKVKATAKARHQTSPMPTSTVHKPWVSTTDYSVPQTKRQPDHRLRFGKADMVKVAQRTCATVPSLLGRSVHVRRALRDPAALPSNRALSRALASTPQSVPTPHCNRQGLQKTLGNTSKPTYKTLDMEAHLKYTKPRKVQGQLDDILKHHNIQSKEDAHLPTNGLIRRFFPKPVSSEMSPHREHNT